MLLNVVICDDIEKSRDIMRKYLERLSIEEIEISGEAQDGAQLINICEETSPDIILLDIDMPNINGIDAAKKIVEFLPDASFIFITAHSSFAVDAFGVYAVDYILKPVSIERLEKSIKHIIKIKSKDNMSKSEKIITLKSNHETYTLNQSNILFVEKVDRKTVIHTHSRKIEINEPLSSIIERLDSEVFVRTHKSYIINRDAIFKISKTRGRTRKVLFEGYDKPAYISRDNIKDFVK